MAFDVLTFFSRLASRFIRSSYAQHRVAVTNYGHTTRAIHTPPPDPPDEHYQGYIISTKEFDYVDRILPKMTVPEPPQHTSYPTPSGWFPPKDLNEITTPYFVERTRNHQYPVYLESLHLRHRTVIRKIGGDIWALEGDLRQYLQERNEKEVFLRVNEVTRQIRIRGAHMRDVSDFLQSKGF